MKEPATHAKAPEAIPQPASPAAARASVPAASGHPMLRLQRTIGNQACQRMIQARLTVGDANDRYEQEAESVARQVVQMPPPPLPAAHPSVVRRKTSEGAGVTPIISPTPAITPIARRAASETPGSFQPGADFEAALGSGSGGSPLPASTRAFMEPRFGADFRGVRIHTGGTADRLNRAIDAQAFTHGKDIYLGESNHDLESTRGKQLLAHELTHTIQQGAVGVTDPGVRKTPSRTPPAVMRFVGTEHATLGNATAATIDLGDGVVLTWGQVVAIAGDEYGTVEEVKSATGTPQGKARLRAALEHDGVAASETSRLPVPTPAQRGEQDTEFVRLAMENVAHFPDEGEALGAWTSHHARAIETAVLAGLANNPKGMNEAYLLEAFGQHFLTDSFSAGHIRTPRKQIVDWYTTTFAPRVVGRLIANLRTRLVNALVAEANPQAPYTPEFLIRGKIQGRVQASIDGMVASLGGMAALTRWVGLGVAGAVSGTLHDAEGEAGVLVASDEHPQPWRAFGDKKLEEKDNAITKEQAMKAVVAAKSQVDSAYLIGAQEGVIRDRATGAPPERVHFAFNSSRVSGPAAAAVEDAAAYLIYHPDARVELVGHTDPIGSATANDALGLRRAQEVGKALAGAGAAPAQVAVRSDGEKSLVTRNPKDFRLNRRTEFHWHRVPGVVDPKQFARDRALAKARTDLGPPFAKVTRFVPRPVEERGGTGNTEIPEWHWGKLAPSTRTAVDAWIRLQVGTKLTAAVSTSPALNDVTESGITLHPRAAVSAIVTQLLASPTAALGNLLDEAPGPP